MASLRKESDRGRTGWRLQFRQGGKRRSLWIGDVSKRVADSIARHINELVIAFESNTTAAANTIQWTKGIDERMHKTLANWQLVHSRKAVPPELRICGNWFEHYTQGRTDLKPHTRTMYRQAATWFTNRFGTNYPLAALTLAEFEGWLRWMKDGRLAEASSNKHAKRVRKMFSEAVKSQLLHANPCDGAKIGGETNVERQHYITREEANAIFDKCDTEWALIFGLCRFAGLRCPTEVLALKWEDVHWDASRLRINSVKTGLRFCPVFPEIEPLLNDAWQVAADRTSYVITRYRGRTSNLRTQLGRITESAGVKPWPKLFVNLRASARTDLEERFPGHVIDSWLGHSKAIADRHYKLVTDAHFERAIAGTSNDGGVLGGVLTAPQQSSGASNKPPETKKGPA